MYQQFAGASDPARRVNLAAFHIQGGEGTFAIVALTVPAQLDLIPLLKSQVADQMEWGVREGYIRKYLGLVAVENGECSGFYTKAIGTEGAVEVSGGLEHESLKNTVIQLTLLCPKDWDETKATDTLSTLLKSVTLK